MGRDGVKVEVPVRSSSISLFFNHPQERWENPGGEETSLFFKYGLYRIPCHKKKDIKPVRETKPTTSHDDGTDNDGHLRGRRTRPSSPDEELYKGRCGHKCRPKTQRNSSPSLFYLPFFLLSDDQSPLNLG